MSFEPGMFTEVMEPRIFWTCRFCGRFNNIFRGVGYKVRKKGTHGYEQCGSCGIQQRIYCENEHDNKSMKIVDKNLRPEYISILSYKQENDIPEDRVVKNKVIKHEGNN